MKFIELKMDILYKWFQELAHKEKIELLEDLAELSKTTVAYPNRQLAMNLISGLGISESEYRVIGNQLYGTDYTDLQAQAERNAMKSLHNYKYD